MTKSTRRFECVQVGTIGKADFASLETVMMEVAYQQKTPSAMNFTLRERQ